MLLCLQRLHVVTGCGWGTIVILLLVIVGSYSSGYGMVWYGIPTPSTEHRASVAYTSELYSDSNDPQAVHRAKTKEMCSKRFGGFIGSFKHKVSHHLASSITISQRNVSSDCNT